MGLIVSILTLGVVSGLLLNQDFFLRDDFLNYHLGVYAELARAFSAGELPLLTQSSWQAGALAGEYQFGVFSPPLAILSVALFSLDLPLNYIAAVFVWVHALILGAGAYFLARRRDLAPELCLMVALASSLNGWMVTWGVSWFAALAGFAWLPWYWWALEQAIERSGDRRYAAAAGVFLALIVTAGFPYACLMAFAVAVSAVGRLAIARRPSAEALPVAWSLLVGLGLSAPAWLMLLEYSGATMRVHTSHPLTPQTDLTVPFKAWLGTVLPTIEAGWRASWLPAHDTRSISMHSGLAPVALLVTALFRLRTKLLRDLRLDFLFLAFLLALASLPGLGVLRWSFRWLPLLFLQLALLAAAAATALQARSPARRRSQRPGFGTVAWLLLVPVSIYAVRVDGDRWPGTLWLAASLLAVASLWWRLESRPGGRLHRQMPWIAVAVSSFVTFGICLQEFPHYHRRVEPHPSPAFDPSVTYLALYTRADADLPLLRFPGQRYFPGNEHLHSGLRFVNGYSPLGPAGTTRALGFDYLGALTMQETRPSRPLGPLLRRMAVDGLVVWPGSRGLRNIPFEEFEVSATIPGAEVHRRRGPPTPRAQVIRRAFFAASPDEMRRQEHSALPLLESPGGKARESGPKDFGQARVTELVEGRHHARATVDARGAVRPVLVSFARPWFPGYRASVDGEPVEVLQLDRMMPAVEAPAGRRSEVLLTYRPASFIAGAALSALTLAGLLAALALASRRRR